MSSYRYLVQYWLESEKELRFLRFMDRDEALLKAKEILNNPMHRQVCVLDVLMLEEIPLEAEVEG